MATNQYSLKFEWDENKNKINIERHGIDFCDARLIFNYPMIIKTDDRKDYNEKRLVGLGILYGSVIFIVFTEREDTIRVISIRRANRNERKIYHEKFKKSD